MSTTLQSNRIPWLALTVFGMLAVGITVAGRFYFVNLKDQIIQEKKNELQAVSELKVWQLVSWRKERLADANFIFSDKFIASRAAGLCEDPSNALYREETLEWMTSIFKNRQFFSISLFDRHDRLILSVHDGNEEPQPYDRKLFEEAAKAKSVLFSDLHNEAGRRLSIDFLVPFFSSRSIDSSVTGMVVLEIDPYRTLYPLVQEWPLPSHTSEALLVRRDADSAIFLSPLRHKEDTPLKIRIPIDNGSVIAAKAVSGIEGIVQAKDYRGVEALAVVKRIPESPWFLVAKSDSEEVFASLEKDEKFVSILVGALIIVIGTMSVLAWRNQYARFYRREYETDVERKALGAQYEYLTKFVNDIFLLVDAKTLRIVEANDRAIETYGYTREELLRMTIEDLRAVEESQEIEDVRKSLRADHRAVFEAVHRRKDGTAFPVEASSRLVEIDGKAFSQSIIRDITERKRVEEQLSLQSAALISAANAIVITDRKGIVTWVNPAYSRLTGYSFDEILGKSTNILKSGKQDALFYKDLWDTILAGRTWHGELINQRKDGSLYNEEMTITPVRNKREETTHFIAIKQDVTDRKRLQEHMLQAQKMESMGTLAGGIAHDFNNILGIILGYSSLIEPLKNDPEKFSEAINAIIRAVDRGSTLVHQILTFARKSESSLRIIDVNDVAKELLSMLIQTFPKVIVFSQSLEENLPTITADPSQLHQALLNLCVNARDAMPSGGTLTLTTKTVDSNAVRKRFPDVTESGYVRISVSDTGTGMDENVRKRIFEPFFTTKGERKGTGLGLAVVYGVVHSHHGFIDVESELGKGTTFHLYFPSSLGTEAQRPDHEAKFPETLSGVETILVVEDEEMLLAMLKFSLERAGYKVLTATDGKEAVEVYKQHESEIQLVLTDMGLPRRGGVEEFFLLKEIRPSVKVVLASGNLDQNVKSRLLQDGAKAFVQKPYIPVEVLRTIRQVLDAS